MKYSELQVGDIVGGEYFKDISPYSSLMCHFDGTILSINDQGITLHSQRLTFVPKRDIRYISKFTENVVEID